MLKHCSLLVASLLMVMAGTVVGQVKPSDLVGKWEYTTQTQDGSRTSTITFSMNEGKLAGEISGGRGGARPLSDISLAADGTLSYTMKFSRQGNEVVQKVTGKLAGDTLMGKTETRRGAREFTAKRVKADAK